jgi:hypothetical protein
VRRTIIVVASLLLAMAVYAANVALWAQREVVDEDAFVASAMTSFTRAGSYGALGTIITDKVVARYPSLLFLQGPLIPLFTALVSTEGFVPALADVSSQVHDVVIGGSSSPVVLDIGDYEDELRDSVSVVSPVLADQIPEEIFTSFEVFGVGELPDAGDAANLAPVATWFALVVAIAAAAILWVTLRDVGWWLIATGASLLMGALATTIIIPLGRGLSGVAFDSEAYRILAENLYTELVGSLARRTWVLSLVGLGLLGVGWLITLGRRRRSAHRATGRTYA